MVELHEVITEEFILMPLYMLFFDRTVKAFDMAIALGMARIVVKVNDRTGADIHAEVFFELVTVVRLDMFNRERSHMEELVKEVFGVGAVQLFVTIGKGKTSDQIYRRDDVAFNIVQKEGDRIDLHQVPRVLWHIVLAA